MRMFDWVIYWLRRPFQSMIPDNTTNTDSDVLAEKQRVKGMTMREIQTTNLVIVSLSKFYGKHLAVNQLSLAVNA